MAYGEELTTVSSAPRSLSSRGNVALTCHRRWVFNSTRLRRVNLLLYSVIPPVLSEAEGTEARLLCPVCRTGMAGPWQRPSQSRHFAHSPARLSGRPRISLTAAHCRPAGSFQKCVKRDIQKQTNSLSWHWIVRMRDLVETLYRLGLCLSSRLSPHWND